MLGFDQIDGHSTTHAFSNATTSISEPLFFERALEINESLIIPIKQQQYQTSNSYRQEVKLNHSKIRR